MAYNISVIYGDGIGKEIVDQAIKVMNEVGNVFHHTFHFERCEAGTEAVQKYGEPLPDKSLRQCQESDAILLGSLWLDKYPELPQEKRPSYVLSLLRKKLELKINLRPISVYKSLAELSPLKNSIIGEGFNILMLRDLAGGMLMSQRYRGIGDYGKEAFDKEYYNEEMIKANACAAFEIARGRSKKVTSLDKAVILESSKLWREVVQEVSADYRDVALVNQYIDDAAAQVITDPHNYDVILTSGMFGDILSDEISALAGTPNVLPSAELNRQGKGLFTPNQIHNKDYSIVGKDIANPIGSILSGAMMLRFAFGLEQESQAIEEAVRRVLNEKYATKDICLPGSKRIGTSEMGSIISEKIRKIGKELV
ncbi:3-isopropylmalate dehydrogenase [Paenibacillus polymyxa]|uniref:3-isopropylmalate dehydrogenase n=1 Tax=Paenibacillus polymyxa TaxID=1406 RepID=UPI00042F0DB6|nr:3-isopropylmalate dehydrogenase [Paenibacillus polymyxa]AHM68064.1 3-isopropylmalate dehydrogenase [Paenibacillus polymyxa SQR-21]AIY08766.1 3-isopropylmalate dehydrogenase [Paenibacillus polymyxa]MBY7738572.1 3-isopropylmalate dehydrogenase [Paenibacillus polymyxa]